MKTTVVNIRHESFDILIDRRTPFGNPFRIGRDGTREEVIEKFRVWLPKQAWLMDMIEQLRGKRLACWCKPEPCHGDVYVEILEKGTRPCTK